MGVVDGGHDRFDGGKGHGDQQEDCGAHARLL